MPAYLRVNVESCREASLVMLRDPSVLEADGCVLDTPETEQLGDGQRLLVETVNEHSNHLRLSSSGTKQTPDMKRII